MSFFLINDFTRTIWSQLQSLGSAAIYGRWCGVRHPSDNTRHKRLHKTKGQRAVYYGSAAWGTGHEDIPGKTKRLYPGGFVAELLYLFFQRQKYWYNCVPGKHQKWIRRKQASGSTQVSWYPWNMARPLSDRLGVLRILIQIMTVMSYGHVRQIWCWIFLYELALCS